MRRSTFALYLKNVLLEEGLQIELSHGLFFGLITGVIAKLLMPGRAMAEVI